MNKVKEKLNVFHITLLIFMTEMNITMFSLPRLIVENIGTNGWIGYLALSVLATFNIFLYWLVYRMGRGASVFQIMECALPKAVMYPVYWALAVFWIFTASFTGKNFFLIFQMLSFQTTNPMFIFLLFCLMVFALLIKNIYNISKTATVFFFMTIWTVGLTVYQFQDWEIVRFSPHLFQLASQGHSFRNWMEVYTTFMGYELCMFLFPHVTKKSKLFQGVFIGHWVITIAQLIVILTAFGFFSFHQIESLLYPIIDLLDFIEMPFINRIENLVFSMFVFANLIVTVMYCFAALTAIKQTCPKVKPNRLEFVIVTMVFFTGYIPKYLGQSEQLLRKVLYTETYIAFIVPVVLICVLLYLKLKGKVPNNES